MPHSFFERLTGSMQGGDAASEKKPSFDDGQKLQSQAKLKQKPFFARKEEEVEKDERELEEDEVELSNISSELERRPLEESPEIPYFRSSGEEGVDTDEGQLMLDVYDNGSHLNVYATVAGVRPEDIDISVADDVLTIR